MTEASTARKTVITCESTIDIKSVEELYTHLQHAVENQLEVEINAGDVQRVDAAVLQVFVAFVQETQSLGMTVTWQSTSDAFRTAAGLLGLEDQLVLPKAA